jgi:hypothetical protein
MTTKTEAQATTVVLSPPGNADQVVLAEWLDQAERDAGRGVSDKAEDLFAPLVYLLQSGSPQCDRRGNGYEGGEAGDFWLRGAIRPVRSGVEGLPVIPCGMTRTWLEFLPNRGGYVTQHDQPPADMESRISHDDSGNEKIVQVRRSNNNVIQDTRQFALLIDGQPYSLGCAGTKHTFARQWQTHFHQLRHPQTNGVLPVWAHKYLLTSIPVSNARGQRWFGLKFTDLGPVTLAEYNAGKRLAEIVARGSLRVETPTGSEAA